MSGPPESRREKDKEKIEEILHDLRVNDTKVASVIRVGKVDNDRSRLLRVECLNTSAKYEILRKSRNLRDIEKYRSIYINPDLTYSQRQRNKTLRDELKFRRELGENVIIQRGKIISKKDAKQDFH